MTIILNILVFAIVLGSIVFVHEFGHFIMAKKNGVYVYEFSIGMGPKIWGFKKGETDYSLRIFPIGGYCSLAGEDLEYDKEMKVPKKMQMQTKKWWQRFLILFFGPCNNFIFAIILILFISLIWGGMTMNPIISSVEKESSAYKSGLKKGDKIISIDNHNIDTSDDISLYIAIANGKKSTFKIERKGKNIEIKIKPTKIKEGKKVSYRYGFGFKQKPIKDFIGKIGYAFNKFGALCKQMVITILYLFTGRIGVSQLSGPVGIYEIVGQTRTAGIENVLFIMAFLSLNVGFVNLLPIPALDGGHILFILIELIKGSPVKPEIENKFHSIGLILLMILMLLITVKDVFTLF